jgi:hypothetical protein
MWQQFHSRLKQWQMRICRHSQENTSYTRDTVSRELKLLFQFLLSFPYTLIYFIFLVGCCTCVRSMTSFEPLGEYFLWLLYSSIFYRQHFSISSARWNKRVFSSLCECNLTISSQPSSSEMSFTAQPKASRIHLKLRCTFQNICLVWREPGSATSRFQSLNNGVL